MITPQNAAATRSMIWRAKTHQASALVSCFVVQQSLFNTPDEDCWDLYALSVLGPNDTVRAITAHVASGQRLKLVSDPDPLTGKTKTAFCHRMGFGKPYKQIRWARPRPKRIASHIFEAAVYSKLMETRYIPDNSEGDEFVITAQSEEELPLAFYRWARMRLPAPMMESWAKIIYRSGISQGTIRPLFGQGIHAAYCNWEARHLRSTIEILGQTGRLPIDMEDKHGQTAI